MVGLSEWGVSIDRSMYNALTHSGSLTGVVGEVGLPLDIGLVRGGDALCVHGVVRVSVMSRGKWEG